MGQGGSGCLHQAACQTASQPATPTLPDDLIIGGGAFGKVWLGKFLRDEMAIKIFEKKHYSFFEKEMRIYTDFIRVSAHENILQYKGSGR